MFYQKTLCQLTFIIQNLNFLHKTLPFTAIRSLPQIFFLIIVFCVKTLSNSLLQIFMTPEDFLRSLTPGMIQPEGLGLDQFKKFDASAMSFKDMKQSLSEDSIFFKLGSSGLISFSDYIFLLTILSTSR